MAAALGSGFAAAVIGRHLANGGVAEKAEARRFFEMHFQMTVPTVT